MVFWEIWTKDTIIYCNCWIEFKLRECLLQYTAFTGKTAFLLYLYAFLWHEIYLSVLCPCPVQLKNLLSYPFVQINFFVQLSPFHFFLLTFLDQHSLSYRWCRWQLSLRNYLLLSLSPLLSVHCLELYSCKRNWRLCKIIMHIFFL